MTGYYLCQLGDVQRWSGKVDSAHSACKDTFGIVEGVSYVYAGRRVPRSMLLKGELKDALMLKHYGVIPGYLKTVFLGGSKEYVFRCQSCMKRIFIETRKAYTEAELKEPQTCQSCLCSTPRTSLNTSSIPATASGNPTTT